MPFLNIKKITSETHHKLMGRFASEENYNAIYRDIANEHYRARKNHLDPWFPEVKTTYDPKYYGGEVTLKKDVILPLHLTAKQEIHSSLSEIGLTDIDPKNLTAKDQHGRVISWSSAVKRLILNDEEIKRLKQERNDIEQNKDLSKEDKLSQIQEVANKISNREMVYQNMINNIANMKSGNKDIKTLEERGIDINDLVIVLTQDPHQMAKMSYDRYWGSNTDDNPVKGLMECDQSSCTTLGEGGYYTDVWAEIERGGCVAYVTTKEDASALKAPLGRVWVRLFSSAEDPSHITLLPEDRLYSINALQFIKDDVISTIKDYVLKMQPNTKDGLYERKGGSYSDSYGDNHGIYNYDFSMLLYNFEHEVKTNLRNFFSKQAKEFFQANPDKFKELEGALQDFKYFLLNEVIQRESKELDFYFDVIRKFQFHYPALNIGFTRLEVRELSNDICAMIQNGYVSFSPYSDGCVTNRNVVSLLKTDPEGFNRVLQHIYHYANSRVHEQAAKNFSYWGFNQEAAALERKNEHKVIKKLYGIDVFSDAEQSAKQTFNTIVDSLLDYDLKIFAKTVQRMHNYILNNIIPTLNEQQLNKFINLFVAALNQSLPQEGYKYGGTLAVYMDLYSLALTAYRDLLPSEVIGQQEGKIKEFIYAVAENPTTLRDALFECGRHLQSSQYLKGLVSDAIHSVTIPTLVNGDRDPQSSFSEMLMISSRAFLDRNELQGALAAEYANKLYKQYLSEEDPHQAKILLAIPVAKRKILELANSDHLFHQYIKSFLYNESDKALGVITQEFRESFLSKQQINNVPNDISKMLMEAYEQYEKNFGGDFIEDFKPQIIEMTQKNPGMLLVIDPFLTEKHPKLRLMYDIPEVKQTFEQFMKEYTKEEDEYAYFIMDRTPLGSFTNIFDAGTVDTDTRSSFIDKLLSGATWHANSTDLNEESLGFADLPQVKERINKVEFVKNYISFQLEHPSPEVRTFISLVNRYLIAREAVDDKESFDKECCSSLKEIQDKVVPTSDLPYHIFPKLRYLKAIPEFYNSGWHAALEAVLKKDSSSEGVTANGPINILKLSCTDFLRLKRII